MKRTLALLFMLLAAPAAGAQEPLNDLPITITRPSGSVNGMMVFWSGDLGWTGNMQSLADAMARRGFGVVGISSLRYFWQAKTPEKMAEDTDRIIEHYRTLWSARTVVVGGYSFGADVLPFAWPYMSQDSRDATTMITLLSPLPRTEFEITFAGMIGIVTGDHDVTEAITRLPADRVFCLLGQHETDMACTVDADHPVTIVPGGHRYNGDMDGVAREIATAL